VSVILIPPEGHAVRNRPHARMPGLAARRSANCANRRACIRKTNRKRHGQQNGAKHAQGTRQNMSWDLTKIVVATVASLCVLLLYAIRTVASRAQISLADTSAGRGPRRRVQRKQYAGQLPALARMTHPFFLIPSPLASYLQAGIRLVGGPDTPTSRGYTMTISCHCCRRPQQRPLVGRPRFPLPCHFDASTPRAAAETGPKLNPNIF